MQREARTTLTKKKTACKACGHVAPSARVDSTGVYEDDRPREFCIRCQALKRVINEAD